MIRTEALQPAAHVITAKHTCPARHIALAYAGFPSICYSPPFMLQNWNFYDEELNSTTQQVNRQKSTLHLEILQFDPSVPRAVFTALHSSSVIARILISQEVHETNDGNLKALLLPLPCRSDAHVGNFSTGKQPEE